MWHGVSTNKSDWSSSCVENMSRAGGYGSSEAGGGAGSSTSSPPAMSDYELQRLEHINRNNEYLASLGLAVVGFGGGGGARAGLATNSPGHEANCEDGDERRCGKAKKKKKKRSPVAVKLEPTRRSSRLTGSKPQYTGEFVDQFFGGDSNGGGSSGRRRKSVIAVRVKRERTPAESLRHLATTLDMSRQWLAASRKALLQIGGGAGEGAGDGGGGAKNSQSKFALASL